ncbi:hypothetical protein ACFX2J_003047 [Malus domestica]
MGSKNQGSDEAHPLPPSPTPYLPERSPSLYHLHSDQAIPLNASPPLRPLCCCTCHSVLNPFSTVDYAAKIWIYPFCFTRNHFPPHYASISDENLPIEKPTSPLVLFSSSTPA